MVRKSRQAYPKWGVPPNQIKLSKSCNIRISLVDPGYLCKQFWKSIYLFLIILYLYLSRSSHLAKSWACITFQSRLKMPNSRQAYITQTGGFLYMWWFLQTEWNSSCNMRISSTDPDYVLKTIFKNHSIYLWSFYHSTYPDFLALQTDLALHYIHPSLA